ncbi:TonB-dependent receptor [Sphingomonas sp. PAMC 26605]|uniref:TonB-dependent receptor n=1 Tax=Sphingomonas sp. PAMC 26605 TaxID=1112214 RepID=UPI00026CD6C8|nr:TonB-dependent receptor [Sphingomonas sp. PAMC 26605]
MRHNLFLGVAIAALAIPAAASAQETTAIIRGSVTANGAPVNNASITITDTSSGTISKSSTDSSGLFTASGLRAGGPYTIDVTSASGNTQVTGVFTVIGAPYDLPINLSTAADGADIVVTASSIKRAGINSDGPQTVLNQRDVAKVASVNRDIRDIERRSPFATFDRSSGGGSAVSFAGVNPRFNRFTINGAQVGDNFGLNPDASPTRRGPIPFDAIGQVSVSIAPYDVRQTNFQGGVVDVTLLSGTNDYHLNGFYSQSTDGLQGNQIKSLPVNLPKYKSETYGVTASGPIIRDKLFFMVSYEKNTDPRPLSPGAVNQVPNLTDAQVASVQNIAKNVYGYDPGGVLAITNNLDEKIVGRIDWNVTEGQRFSLSYINAFDSNDNLQNSSSSTTSPALGLASNAYKLTELLRAGIAQLNSDWSDKLSTETRFVYKSYTRGQDPELGRGFAQFRVCTAPTSVLAPVAGNGDNATSCGNGNPVVALGPDISRQTNALFTDTYDGSFLLRLKAGQHDFKGLFEYAENRTTNAFLQYSAGSYYFDSLADFQAKNASSFDYQNALTLNPNDTTSNFKYGVYSFALQDDWTISPELRITYGARYDLYGSRSPVINNPNFYNRYGFSNTNNFDGLEAFQPRLSFSYKPTSKLSVRGGVGIFSGGTPDIYFSNSYSNSGFIQNRISTVNRAAGGVGGTTACTAPYTGANAALCQVALNGVSGTTIPGQINTFLQQPTTLATAPTASVANNFRLPSQTRATLSVDYRLFGVDLGADYVFSKVNDAVTFTDLRSRVVGTLPDGRPRYTFVPTPGVTGQTSDTNTDIQIGNTGKGRSHIFTLRANKDFGWGLSVGGSYTWQDVKDVSNATSSVATSLYSAQAAIDPNNAAYGISSNQTKWQFKYNVGFDHAFYGDYRTIVQLFGETRAGQPYSFSMQDTASGRSAVFGTTGNTDHYLLYVPTSTSDPLVTYAPGDTTTAAALNNLINNTQLKNFRGRIAPKNIARARANTRIDLHLEQEIPTFVFHSRISIFADIENLPNLLNKNWGGSYYTGFPYTSAVVQVTCLNAAGAALTGPVGSATNPANACAKYQYSSFKSPTESVNTAQSLYLIRVGARFKF